jgi:hypothetical protein
LQPELEELSNMRRFTCATLLLLGLPACGAQVPPDYRGEPLATLHGNIVSQLKGGVPDSDVALLWPDWSKGDASGTYHTTAVRVPVQTELPARFTLTLFEPPPESAYPPHQKDFWGTRFSSATIALVKRGVNADDALLCCDGKVLAYIDNYLFTYAEGNGKHDLATPDGGTESLTIEQGWSLVRQDVTHCADGFDQACIDQRLAAGDSEAFAKERCAINPKSITHPVRVPLDTELTLTVRELPPPWVPQEYTVPCP